MRYHIYFQKNDIDILILLHTWKLADITRVVVRAEIEGKTLNLPLPQIPAKGVRPLRTMGLRLDDKHDKDVIDWLKEIRPGCVGIVIKTLIRRAMERADIRAFLTDPGRLTLISRTAIEARLVKKQETGQDSSSVQMFFNAAELKDALEQGTETTIVDDDTGQPQKTSDREDLFDLI